VRGGGKEGRREGGKEGEGKKEREDGQKGII